MDEKHILISLGDDKVKQIGEVIGNKTCNKILELLSLEKLTATDISKKLKIPLNTTDYNIKKLIKSGLIEKSSYFWSVKGKKMPTYKVSNRKIIISPRKPLNKIFATTLGLTGLVALTIREFTRKSIQEFSTNVQPMLTGGARTFGKEADGIADVAYGAAKEPVEEIGRTALESMSMNAGVTDAIISTAASPSFWQSLDPWSWFLFGAWFAVLIFFIFTLWSERKSK